MKLGRVKIKLVSKPFLLLEHCWVCAPWTQMLRSNFQKRHGTWFERNEHHYLWGKWGFVQKGVYFHTFKNNLSVYSGLKHRSRSSLNELSSFALALDPNNHYHMQHIDRHFTWTTFLSLFNNWNPKHVFSYLILNISLCYGHYTFWIHKLWSQNK